MSSSRKTLSKLISTVQLTKCPYPTIIEQYVVGQSEPIKYKSKLYAFQEPNVKVLEPGMCLWKFMSREKLNKLLKIEERRAMRREIGKLRREVLSRIPMVRRHRSPSYLSILNLPDYEVC